MTDLGELKNRVNTAIEHLSEVQQARRGQHDRLIQLLGDLEVKFDARHEELSYCRSRIVDLENANNQLAGLLDKVVNLIDSCAVDDPNDPIYRASEMATQLVRLCSRDTASAPSNAAAEDAGDTAPRPDQPPTASTGAASLGDAAPRSGGSASVRPFAAVAGRRFADVGEDELERERLFEAAAGQAAMPQHVVDAVRQARAVAPSAGRPAPSAAAPAAEHDGAGFAATLAKVAQAVRTSQEEAGAEAPSAPGRSASASGDDHAQMMDFPGIDNVSGFDIEHDTMVSLADEPAAGEAPQDGRATVRDADIEALMGRIQDAAQRAKVRSEDGDAIDDKRRRGGGPTSDDTGTG